MNFFRHSHFSVLVAVTLLEKCCMASADLFNSGEQTSCFSPHWFLLYFVSIMSCAFLVNIGYKVSWNMRKLHGFRSSGASAYNPDLCYPFINAAASNNSVSGQ